MTTMRTFDLTFHLATVPPVFRRDNHALIMVTDTEGNFILGGKKRYPDQIYRFVGGGIEKGENEHLAACRELEEELGIKTTPAELTPVAIVKAVFESPDEQPIHFTTFLYHYQLPSGAVPHPSDDLDALHTLTPSALRELITRFQQLPTVPDPDLCFSWADYGQVYAKIHQIGLDELTTHPVHSK